LVSLKYAKGLHLDKSGVNFTNIWQAAFMSADPNSKKRHCFFVLLESERLKAACKHNAEINHSRRQFHQLSMNSFYVCRSQMHKKESQVSSVIWHFWDLRVWKLHVKRWWNWHQVDESGRTKTTSLDKGCYNNGQR